MDFRDELQVGQHTFGITAKGQPAIDGQRASVAVEFTGASTDGEIIAEGNLLIALDALADTGTFLNRTLDGLGALNGRPRRSRSARAPNAGQPWTDDDGRLLRERWMRSRDGSSASELIGELAADFGRTRSAIRAQLPRVDCDPDVPGRALADAAEP
ncbi:hypothetical protein [Saccharopolyspora taberi]